MCGVVGLIGTAPVHDALLRGLYALQHRGRDAAGLAVADGDGFALHRVRGPVSGLETKVEPRLPGHAGIGHVRYSTSGSDGDLDAAQPIRVDDSVWAHNGQVVNVDEVADRAAPDARRDLDSALMVRVIHQELAERGTAAALRRWSADARGAWSVTALLRVEGKLTLLAWRDAHGLRPLAYGRTADGWAVASESDGLRALGAVEERAVPPGTAVLLRAGCAAEVIAIMAPQPAACAFEAIYFAAASAQLDAGLARTLRRSLGLALATRFAHVPLDAVVAIPSTARTAAAATAEALGVPLEEGFEPSEPERSFILSQPEARAMTAHAKLTPRRDVFAGRRILLVDDSVVRGVTLDAAIARIRSCGPVAVHLGVAAPPVRHPCFYGIDLPSPAELVAAPHPDPEAALAARWVLDSVRFLPTSSLTDVLGAAACTACFTGRRPVPVSVAEAEAIHRRRLPVRSR